MTETPRQRGPQALQQDVLRYWLALLRHEEALTARPRARRPGTAGRVEPNVRQPVAGQEYLKLPKGAGSARFCVGRSGALELEPGPEWCAFFEDWLHSRYRGAEGNVDAMRQLVAFPAIHLPRDELGGLLRFVARADWLTAAGKALEIPNYRARVGGETPATPARLRLTAAASEADEPLPFFVDSRLLRDVLRIDGERLDAFFAELRGPERIAPRDLVGRLCRLLAQQLALDSDAASLPEQAKAHERKPHEQKPAEAAHERKPHEQKPAEAAHEPPSPSEPSVKNHPAASAAQRPRTSAAAPAASATEESDAALFQQLHELARRRLRQLGSKSRAYGVALVMNTSRNRATFHVQRDLAAALELAAAGNLTEGPLHEYLCAARSAAGRGSLRGRLNGARLTPSQCAAASRALGSTLTAVQGPPGTGKTTLTLNLAAHALVKRMAPLEQGHRLTGDLFVVASTNNRAVDNVIAPLVSELPLERLPLALRVGSREIVDKVTAPQLSRAIDWLKRAPDLAPGQLKAATQAYRAAREALEEALAPTRRLTALRQEQQLLGATLERLTAQAEKGAPRAALVQALAQVAPEANLDSLGPSNALRATLAPLATRLRELSQLAEPGRGQPAAKLASHFAHTERHQLKALSQRLGTQPVLGLPPALSAHPSDEEAREVWEEAAEQALGRLLALSTALETHTDPAELERQRSRVAGRLEKLERELAALSLQAETKGDTAPPQNARQEPGATPSPSTAADDGGGDPHHALHLALFTTATQLREVWAVHNRSSLLESLNRAQQVASRTGSLRSLLSSPKGAGLWLRRLFPTWGCTLLSLGNNFPPEPGCLQRVVVDEAGQCHGAYAVAALLRAGSALVVGDVHQLEPVAALTAAEEKRVLSSLKLSTSEAHIAPFRMHEGAPTSAQRIADAAVSDRPTLVDHFRCQPPIAAICEKLCHYGLITRTRPASCRALAPALSAPVLFSSIAGAQERFSGSWKNEPELQVAVRWVLYLLERGLPPADLGVITPYRGQLEHLWRQMQQHRVPLERPQNASSEEALPLLGQQLLGAQLSGPGGGVAVGTVHRFQGGERRVILLSTTVTETRSLGFIDGQVNLVNVAASRAREHLITLGHEPTLRAGKHTRALLEGASELPGEPPLEP